MRDNDVRKVIREFNERGFDSLRPNYRQRAPQSVAVVLNTRRGSCSWGFCRKDRSRPLPVGVS